MSAEQKEAQGKLRRLLLRADKELTECLAEFGTCMGIAVSGQRRNYLRALVHRAHAKLRFVQLVASRAWSRDAALNTVEAAEGRLSAAQCWRSVSGLLEESYRELLNVVDIAEHLQRVHETALLQYAPDRSQLLKTSSCAVQFMADLVPLLKLRGGGRAAGGLPPWINAFAMYSDFLQECNERGDDREQVVRAASQPVSCVRVPVFVCMYAWLHLLCACGCGFGLSWFHLGARPASPR